MIKITCDRCRKVIDWRNHPAFAFMSGSMYPNSCCDSFSKDEQYNTVESVAVKSKDGLRYLDLCDECKQYVYNFIFNPDDIKNILKEVED